MQQALWASEPETLQLPDASIRYQPDFILDHQVLFEQLLESTEWQQDIIQMYGKSIAVPRLSAWYGDSDKDYHFSGLHLKPKPWSGLLDNFRQQLNQRLDRCFNSVLANYYRDGQDSVAWHSDNEPELGRQPCIASLSFGATRRFSLKHKQTGQVAHVDLAGGSLLVMEGETQHYWLHQVAKSKGCHLPRINLTYRTIMTSGSSS